MAEKPKLVGLFLDDYRNPQDITWVEGFPVNVEWKVVRNFWQFIGALISGKKFDVISYDHDLEEFHYRDMLDGNIDFDYDSYEEKCGYHCAVYAKSFYGGNHPTYFVHSMNEVGKKNIEQVLGERA